MGAKRIGNKKIFYFEGNRNNLTKYKDNTFKINHIQIINILNF